MQCRLLGSAHFLVGFNPHPLRRADAITGYKVKHARDMFQSSPAPKSGCNARGDSCEFCQKMFQSSPAPKSGCNGNNANTSKQTQKVSILTRSEERMQCTVNLDKVRTALGFNPHPLRRADAIIHQGNNTFRYFGFNPHPLRRADAIALEKRYPTIADVSILTRSEERMQCTARKLKRCRNVSILTRSEERMQCEQQSSTTKPPQCFNPHPLRRADAMY